MKTRLPIVRLSCGWISALAATALVADSANANSTISTTDRHAYAANAGWIDFRPSAGDGVQVDETFLSGYAYSANIGWISFEQQWGQPAMNYSTGRFSGHAYAANAGWIALDTPSSDLAAASIAAPADSDGDGISDAWEQSKFGNLTSATATSDADRDGASDLGEYLAGTEPSDAASHLRIVSHSYNTSHQTASLTFTSAPNRRYLIEHDSDLQGPWTDSGFGLLSPDSGANTSRTFAHPASSKLFFRVQARKPLNP